MCLHLDFLIVLVAMGEVSNFGAYAFAPTILVTPLGAISVVVRYDILQMYSCKWTTLFCLELENV